ncbi:uncharacterized protein PG998_000116 [Apiospora kogelbergensis]|uniref:uncharacterized protein n=1 Tax=Apiospora kogelbergensis TaxID=1337665 RepID=UPI003130AB74
MTRFNVSVSWVAPDWEHFNFTNCSLYAKFASTIYRLQVLGIGDGSEVGRYDLCAAQLDAMHNYLFSGFPPNSTEPSNSTATLWYQLNCNASEPWTDPKSFMVISNMFEHMSNAQDPFTFCNSELQSELDVQGNADIAGNGAMIAYFVEGALVTMFAAAQAVELLRHRFHSSGTARQDNLQSILDSFRASIPTFFWTSVLLCLGILAASLNSLAASSQEDLEAEIIKWRDGATFGNYDAYLAIMASACCSYPVFLSGFLLQSRGRRRRLLNAAIPMFVGVLLSVIWALFYRSTHNRTSALRRLMASTYVRIFNTDELDRGPFRYATFSGVAMRFWVSEKVGVAPRLLDIHQPRTADHPPSNNVVYAC